MSWRVTWSGIIETYLKPKLTPANTVQKRDGRIRIRRGKNIPFSSHYRMVMGDGESEVHNFLLLLSIGQVWSLEWVVHSGADSRCGSLDIRKKGVRELSCSE